jgi:hypothetical protein
LTALEPAPIDHWEPWTPTELAARMAPSGIGWCVVGGWAIDLHLGRVTREHEDLEFAVPRADDLAARTALRELEAFTPSDHVLHHLPHDGLRRPETHQTWMLDPVARLWRVDVMLEPGDDDTWVYRRDESVTAPRSFMERRTADGITYLGPHGALFYKGAKGETRPKDEADFAVAAPTLTDDERGWLVETLARVRPEHPWLVALCQLRKPE